MVKSTPDGYLPVTLAAPIEPAAIAFDIDGVVADTMTLFLDIARDVHQVRHITYEDITAYSLSECLDLEIGIIDDVIERITVGDYRILLKPIDGAANVLRRLAKCHQPLLFVTARPTLTAIDQWICETLRLPRRDMEIIATGSFDGKVDVLLDHGRSFFVDDRLETCEQMARCGITPILFRQPWNRRPHALIEVADWQTLAQLLHLESDGKDRQ